MKLAVNYSTVLLQLLQANPDLPVDSIKVPTIPFPDCWEQFHEGITHKNLLPHLAQPGVISLGNPRPEEAFNPVIVRKVLDLARSSYLSTHLEPRLEYFPDFCDSKDLYDPALRSAMIERFLRTIRKVKQSLGIPLVVENFPYYTWWRHYKLGSDPGFISEICETGDCGFLLDISHAQCSAWHFHMDIRDYLAALPIQRVREIHLAGSIIRPEGLRDAHTALNPTDYLILEEVLRRADPEFITLEYGGMPDRIQNIDGSFEPLHRNDPLELQTMIERITDLIRVYP